MTPPRFWYRTRPSVTAHFLRIFSCLWIAASRLRAKYAHPYTSRLPVICVGNATLGGAGKTPTAKALMRGFRAAHLAANPCFLTRGYLGLTRVATHVSSPDAGIYGDEAVLLSRHAPTIVSRDRVNGLKLAEVSGHDFVIADDGFQNPHFSKTSSLLVIDGAAGIGNGLIAPAGPMRETLDEALARATAVLIIGEDAHGIMSRVTKPIFRGHMRPVNANPSGKYVAFAGIGRPDKFFTTLRDAGYDVVETIAFPDHHAYDDADRMRLERLAARHGAKLITTEKDRVRMTQKMAAESLPVELQIDDLPRLLALLKGPA